MTPFLLSATQGKISPPPPPPDFPPPIFPTPPQVLGIEMGEVAELNLRVDSVTAPPSLELGENAELNLRSNSVSEMTLDSVRDALIRQEDTIIFSLIERSKFPLNSPAYCRSSASIPGFSGSLVQVVVKGIETIQAKAGRYENPEEHPFFPDGLSLSSVEPAFEYPKFLHPAAASININKAIWDVFFNQLLPLFIVSGDDGNYASTAASDLQCLQALSRRIHYGKFVAEVKFRNAPQEYEPAIRAKDRDGLMKLLTFETVEEMVKKRVEKKAMIFGQEVTLGDNGTDAKYKVDPAVVSRLYGDWVMPLTKEVQVEYLLRRLD